jgi:hypothetical protein
MRLRPDVPSLIAGMVVIALGIVLMLDFVGAAELRFSVIAPIVCAAAGAILLASGLSRRA